MSIMNFHYAIASILTLIISLVVGFIVFWKNKESLVNRIYFLLTFSTSIWALGIFFHAVIQSKESCLFWGRFAHIGASFIAVSYLHFILSFLGSVDRKKVIIRVGYIIAIVMSILAFVPQFFKSVSPKIGLRLWADPGVLYPTFMIFFIIYPLYGFLMALKEYPLLSGYKRNQLKYIIISSFVGFGGGSSTFLAVYGIKIGLIHPFALYLVSFYNIVIAYAIIKHRLMDIRVAISRLTIFTVVYALVLGVPFYIGYTTKAWFPSTFLAILLASLGPFMFNCLRQYAENLLLAQQRRYQQILLKASEGMVREHNLDRLLKLIVRMVKKTVRIKSAGLFFYDKESKTYLLKEIRGRSSFSEKITLKEESPLISYIKSKNEPFLFSELPFKLRTPLEDVLEEIPDLIVPSSVERKLLGFLLLGEKEDRSIYTQDDINIFKILSHQAALAIENCLFLEEFRKTQQRIANAEKLASIGGMAEGMAHQLRNRLNIFSSASIATQTNIEAILEDFPQIISNNPQIKKALDNILNTAQLIDREVERTANMLKGILEFAALEKKENFFQEFSLKEILDRSIELVKIKHHLSSFPLNFYLPSDTTIYGIKPQILESVYNLLDNSWEAIQERISRASGERKFFKPQVNFKLVQNQKASLIIVSDNGIGIKEEDKSKIFSPFFTTKPSSKSGTGIGMYVVKRLIEENHRGRIWFESKRGEGTTFYIELPKKEKGFK